MQSVRFNCKTSLHLIVQPEEKHPGPLNDLNANDTHARDAKEQQTRHPIARRIIQQCGQAAQDLLGPRVVDPAVLTDPADALLRRPPRVRTKDRQQMIEGFTHLASAPPQTAPAWNNRRALVASQGSTPPL